MTVLNNADQMFSGSEQVMGVYQGSDFIWGPFNKATGGTEATITNYNGSGETWKTHTFTSGTSSLNVSMSMQPFRVLVVGGGGGGNCNTYGGGGGGGGALHYNAAQTLSVGSYPVTVGTGGPKGGPESARYTPDDPTYKGDGRPSSFNGVTAGGGGGGATYANVGRNAPSGGGGGGGGSHAGLNAGGSGGIGGSGAASNNTEGGN